MIDKIETGLTLDVTSTGGDLLNIFPNWTFSQICGLLEYSGSRVGGVYRNQGPILAQEPVKKII